MTALAFVLCVINAALWLTIAPGMSVAWALLAATSLKLTAWSRK